MLGYGRFTTLFLALFIAIASTGYQSGHAKTTSALRASSAAASSAPSPKTIGNPAAVAEHASAKGKLPARDSALTVYNNPEYGILFRYPRIYSLDEAEEDSDEAASLETQKTLEVEQSGAMLVATVEIPADAYPRTTFVSGTLRLVVNREVLQGACRAFVAPDEDGFTTGSSFVDGVEFHWRERGTVAAGTSYYDREYAGFANGVCYEFQAEVVSSNVIDPEFPLKPADTAKIVRLFDRIVASSQFHAPTPAADSGSESEQ